MKKYKLIAVLAASMAFTTGCYDLDVFPEDQLNSTTFFQTQAHADQAMMGVYSLMTDEEKPGLAGLLVLRGYNLNHFALYDLPDW